MQLDVLTAGLFSPTIAWRTSKRHIVEQMTTAERMAIARRTTQQLRDRSPEIRRYLENAATTRHRNAKLLFSKELISSGLLPEPEVAQYKRMARVASAQTKHQQDTAVFLQNESGYRICSLCYLANDSAHEFAGELLQDLEHLSAQQETLFHALQLNDLLGVLIKRASKYPEYDVDTQLKQFEAILVEYTRSIRAGLEKCRQQFAGRSVGDHIDRELAKLPKSSDERYFNMLVFVAMKSRFEELNLTLSSELASIAAPVLKAHPDLHLQTVI